ncbi:MAG: hypothetical protein CBC78_003290 [Candidatus Pelagibacter sp. TMED118]|nr:MAG: hypothetical protein CBC78_003290 [Candidatus Pelagibacter sp. TMED118]
MLKKLFHIFNFFLLILYLYPGSIIGYVLYNNLLKQPQLTNDFLSISSNHFYTFFIISLLGLLSFRDAKKIISYLILISIFLELSHLVIPNRSFQFSDLFGNILGVIMSLILITIYKYRRR